MFVVAGVGDEWHGEDAHHVGEALLERRDRALGDAVVREAKQEIYAREVTDGKTGAVGAAHARDGGGVAVVQRRAVLAVEEREQLVVIQRGDVVPLDGHGGGTAAGGIHRRGHRERHREGKGRRR